MGFFRRGKKKQQPDAAAAPAPTAPAPATTAVSEKKQPLLQEEHDPAPEAPVMAETPKGAPAWADVDAHREDPEVAVAEPMVSDEPEKRETPDLWDINYILGCFGATGFVKYGLWAAVVVGAAGAFLLARDTALNNRKLNVAFIGNSYFFVNDLPSVMEMVSGEHMFQDSCLHGSGSLLNILKTGNGMDYRWRSENAMIKGKEWVTQGNSLTYLYDMGACSVPQLLTGQDNMLSYGNQLGYFLNDGGNPCFNDVNYLDYEKSFNYSSPWDFVVMVDQAKRMCFEDAREEALLALNYTYGPILKEIGATPVIVQPHAFWSEYVNMSGLTDVPTFSSKIKDGAKIYKEFLDTKLGAFKKTRIAPVGDAFLTVWEDDLDLWEKLFLEDGVHPSGYGTYLYAMVVHATVYRTMPPRGRVILDDTMHLFSTARKLHSNETGMPSKKEAQQLYSLARKVALYGHKPKSYKYTSTMSDKEIEDEIDEDFDEEEDGEYYEDSEYYNGRN